MTPIAWCAAVWRRLRRGGETERDLADELAAAEDSLVSDALSRGTRESDARRLAAMHLGGRLQLRERVREQWAGARVDSLLTDVRYVVRGMRQRPGFLAVSAGTLALGIGANVAVLVATWVVLIRPLPYEHADRLAVVKQVFADGRELGIVPGDVPGWIAGLRAVEAAAAYHSRDLTLRGVGAPRSVRIAYVTDRFFGVLGVSVARGRTFVASESSDAAVLSAALAEAIERETHGAAIGVPISVGRRDYTVVGVMPRSFAFPSEEVDVWLPAPAAGSVPPAEAGYYALIVRAKAGVSDEQLRGDAARVLRDVRGPSDKSRALVASLDATVRDPFRAALRAALLAALVVLLVTCANVATLFVGQAIARRREIATQRALGAPTTRLIRRVAIEVVLTSMAASVTGVLMACAGIRAFVWMAGDLVPGLATASLDAVSTSAIVGVTCFAALGCGVVPAWHVARSGRRPQTALLIRPAAWRIRAGLMVCQVALSVALLCGAGLLARTVVTLLRTDPGFEPADAIAVKMVLSDLTLYDDVPHRARLDDLLTRVRVLPGVRHAGVGSTLPPRRAPITIGIRYVDEERDEFQFLTLASVTPGFLQALGVRRLDGRDFTASDAQSEEGAVVITEAAGRLLFGTRDPLGRILKRLPPIAGPTQPRIVGVVPDLKYAGLDVPSSGGVFVPWARRPIGTAFLVVRAAPGIAQGLEPSIRQLVRAFDPSMPEPEVVTLADVLGQSIAGRRLRLAPALALGSLALCITLVGLLGTLRRLVGERRHELAVRVALGATPGQIRRLVLRTGGAVVAAGVIVGIGLSLGLGRAVSTLLYGVSPHDAWTLGVVGGLVGTVSLLVCDIPARAATREDPIVNLRCE